MERGAAAAMVWMRMRSPAALAANPTKEAAAAGAGRRGLRGVGGFRGPGRRQRRLARRGHAGSTVDMAVAVLKNVGASRPWGASRSSPPRPVQHGFGFWRQVMRFHRLPRLQQLHLTDNSIDEVWPLPPPSADAVAAASAAKAASAKAKDPRR